MRCWRPTHLSTWNVRRCCCVTGHAEDVRHERHVLEHGLGRQQLEVLEHEPERAAVGLHLARLERRQVPSVHHQLAIGRHVAAQEQPQERRLPRAARPGEEDELALVDTHGQIAQRVDATAVELREVDRVNHVGWALPDRVSSSEGP